MQPYDHKKIEKKWQKVWDKKQLYKAKDFSEQPKFYSLIEFPFPSGDGMHTGHLRSNTAMDIVSRKRRMEGYNVLYPIGWDAFGLPTENYAIKTGKHPAVVTKKNTDNFRKQLKSAGFSFDWSREINTTDPKYYKWTQWIFLQFYKHNLAYKKKMLINWCPKDKIGLANEEVVDGKCERCGTPVEKREKEQWMLAITKYADRLDKDLDDVNFLEKIKIQQRNWIGKSEGAEIDFSLKDSKEKIKVFTTRPDTLFGVSYMVLAPEHELVQKLFSQISNKQEVEKYIQESKDKSEIERTTEKKDKTGVELKGIKAINPANKEEIPVFIADYVLANYGTGAIMAVPAHDERDNAFAQKFNLPIKQVVDPSFEKTQGADALRPDKQYVERHAVLCIIKHWSEDKYLVSEWKTNDWKGFIIGGIEEGEDESVASVREVAEETGYTSSQYIKTVGRVHSRFYHDVKDVNRIAHFKVAYVELKDGTQNETAEEEKKLHDIVWIAKDKVRDTVNRPDLKAAWDLYTDSLIYTEHGPLINSGKFDRLNSKEAQKEITQFAGGKMVTTYKLRDWVFSRQRYWGEPIPIIHCEKCALRDPSGQGIVPVPEKDLPVKLPNVKNYLPTDTGESPLAAIKKFVNTKCPNCKSPAKRETDTMPNWAGSSWYFLRYIDPKNTKAFADFKKMKFWQPVDWYNGGMEHTTLHLLYSRFWNKFLFDIGLVPTSEPYMKRTSHGLILAGDGEKMSKSRGNVVSPDSIIEQYGADSLRMYQMFMGPFDQHVAWSMEGIIGPRRFLERVWKLQEKVVPRAAFDSELESLIHKTIKKVSEDIESMSFNTAISSLMILLNAIEKKDQVATSYYKHFLKLLAPFAPHVTEEIWQGGVLKGKSTIHLEGWDKADESKITAQLVVVAVQVNGKVRGELTIDPNSSEEDVRQKALNISHIIKWIEGKEIKKVIYIKGRIVNIVVG